MRYLASLGLIAALAFTSVTLAQPAGQEGGQASSEAEKPPEQADAKHGPPSYKDMSLAALAGLVLFIFGVTQLSKGLEELNTTACATRSRA